jgi:hypothetical protein
MRIKRCMMMMVGKCNVLRAKFFICLCSLSRQKHLSKLCEIERLHFLLKAIVCYQLINYSYEHVSSYYWNAEEESMCSKREYSGYR